ncbi:hypothetical protein P7K49_000048 [Saguinus oedipus]|uniref:Uncharacterized protein n=1 Tax=Saguinus oedipus TaxID=9490 RepID=A0ABQ9WAM7_SAGOE|nr:hypothetical protein P7K49_000048 [Saguinus oedipus]
MELPQGMKKTMTEEAVFEAEALVQREPGRPGTRPSAHPASSAHAATSGPANPQILT